MDRPPPPPVQAELLEIVDGVALYPYAPTQWMPLSEWQSITQLSPGVPVKTVELWRCLFGVGYSTVVYGVFKDYAVYISRTPLPGAPSWCTEGFIFDWNPNTGIVPAVDIARHPFLPAIIYGYSTTSWDPILPPNYIEIRQVSVVSGATLHTTRLYPYYLAGGVVRSRGAAMLEGVALDYFGTLTVTGRKSGSLDGEIGSGSHFTAKYNYFILNPDPQPAPTSVVAYE